MIPAFSTHFFVYAPLSVNHLRMLVKHGFSYVELWCAEGHIHFAPQSWRELKRWCADCGVQVKAGHGPFYDRVTQDPSLRRVFHLSDEGSSGREAMDWTRRALEFLSELQAEIMVIHTGFHKGDLFVRMDRLAERVRTILDEWDISLAFETEPHTYCSASVMTTFIETYLDAHPRAGICLDLGHANVYGGVMEELKSATKRLLYVHASDNSGTADAHLVPGEGNISWSRVLEELEKRKTPLQYFTLEIRDHTRGKATFSELENVIEQCARWRDEHRRYFS